jgi:hypothetical protein
MRLWTPAAVGFDMILCCCCMPATPLLLRCTPLPLELMLYATLLLLLLLCATAADQ